MAADKHRPHHPEEYKKLLEWAAPAKSILEIGSRYGYTLLDFAKAKPQRIVSVDLPAAGDWGCVGSDVVLKENIEKIKQMGIDAHLFLGNSANTNIINAVYDLGPFDFVFIDGDHRYEGVLNDFLNYGGIGEVVVFHDIVKPHPSENQNLGVWKLWEEIGNGCETFIAPGSKMGIGRLG